MIVRSVKVISRPHCDHTQCCSAVPVNLDTMSHTLKRKADEIDDSDDEEPMLGRQVLPVANLPDNYHDVPMDGLQYLFTVR